MGKGDRSAIVPCYNLPMAVDRDIFREAIQARAAKVRTARESGADRSFDAWDAAELDYLEDVLRRLDQGESVESVYVRAAGELPELEERVAGEEAHSTFDWYDDHYYEKIYSGKLSACKAVLRAYRG